MAHLYEFLIAMVLVPVLLAGAVTVQRLWQAGSTYGRHTSWRGCGACEHDTDCGDASACPTNPRVTRRGNQ